MENNNKTTLKEFILAGLSEMPNLNSFLIFAFMLIYIVTVLGNVSIILAYKHSPNLHKPMYFLLANFSFLEICYISDTCPKLLSSSLTDHKSISFYGCVSQMYFGLLFAGTEFYILASMAYDRYSAICRPLLYNIIMNKVSCIRLVGGSWVIGALNAVIHTSLTFTLPFCGSNKINHYYCDIPPLLKLACVDTKTNEISVFLISGCVIIGSFIFTMISYINIISAILKIKSSTGRKKAFSTCTSHLMAVFVLYGSIFSVYFKPKSKYEIEQDRVVSVLYTVVAPLLNPFIYSIRNNEMKSALQKLLQAMQKKC
ncbi:olfactory receptor 1020-like [Hyla sarda]|uniref:olfactory receptor 1020-like n=1 Tax=Hyla sarda TaxID=327740 RepID=UPI0024C41B13|nr:olfactory receptor 1020-like [Hyla sarda]